MEFNKQKINKFVKKSGIDNDPLPSNKDDKFIKEGKTLSNIEAFELGKFPDIILLNIESIFSFELLRLFQAQYFRLEQ